MDFTCVGKRVAKVLPIALLLISISTAGQDWELKHEEEGIKVYTRPVENSDIKVCVVSIPENSTV